MKKTLAEEKKMNRAAERVHQVLKQKKNPKIKLLGDSITHGVGGTGWQQTGEEIVPGWRTSPHSFCWATLFRDYMAKTYGATVVNKACTGTKVEFIIEHFDTLVEKDDDLILCTIGTNNRHQFFHEGERLPKEIFRERLWQRILTLYEKFLETGIPVIMIANIPATAAREADGDDVWRVLHMSDIHELYQQLEREKGAVVYSLYHDFSAYCKEKEIPLEKVLGDGLHPNDEGYRIMFRLLCSAFEL